MTDELLARLTERMRARQWWNVFVPCHPAYTNGRIKDIEGEIERAKADATDPAP